VSEDTELEEYSVYSDAITEAIARIPSAILELDEDQLRKKIDPSIKDYELKRAFWAEVVAKQAKRRKMILTKVYRNIFSKESFYRIIKDPARMAWLIHPVTSYEDKTQAALDKVTERYEELISMEITSTKKVKDEDGEDKWITEVDPKKALVLLSVIRNLEDRLKGTSIQRQVTVNTGRPTDGSGNAVGTMNMQEVKDRMKELEHQLGDKGGFSEGESVAHGHEMSGEGESGDTTVQVRGHGGDENDEQLSDKLTPKTIDIKSGDYREIDK